MTVVPRVDLTYTGDSYGNIFNGNPNGEALYQATSRASIHDNLFVNGTGAADTIVISRTSASTIARSSTISQPIAMRPSDDCSALRCSSARSSTTVLATEMAMLFEARTGCPAHQRGMARFEFVQWQHRQALHRLLQPQLQRVEQRAARAFDPAARLRAHGGRGAGDRRARRRTHSTAA